MIDFLVTIPQILMRCEITTCFTTKTGLVMLKNENLRQIGRGHEVSGQRGGSVGDTGATRSNRFIYMELSTLSHFAFGRRTVRTCLGALARSSVFAGVINYFNCVLIVR